MTIIGRIVLFLLLFGPACLLFSQWSAVGRHAYGQACPTVSGINPASGNIGSTVTISGTNFTGVTSVRFFNNVIANFTINSATQITTTVPATAVSGPITLFKDSCSNVQTASFTVTVACPTVSNFNPTSGNVGTTVTITGTNCTGVTSVRFFNNVTANFTINSDTQITATVPATAVTGPITLTKDNCSNVQTASFTVGTGGSCTVKVDYQFQNTRSSSTGSPPALTDLIQSGNPTNTFSTDTVDGSSRTVLSFPEENGLALQPTTGVIANNVYTIVMLFKLGRVTGYQRILDFRTPANNAGVYNLDGNLTFYNLGVSGSGAPLNNSTYAQLVFTRDASKNVKAYVNGTQHFSFVDSGDLAVIDASNRLSFFQDDGLEGVDGKVARIRLYDCALTASEVAALDRLPTGGGGSCPTVSGINPTSGAVGTSVAISGTNFTGVTAVKFGNNVNATITGNTGTQLTVTVPSGAVTGPITISKTGCADVQTATFTVSTYPITLAQQAYLKASNTDIGDRFGDSVALSGDTLVVGVTSEDSSATGVNGDQSNNSATEAGAVYVFVRNAGVWTQQAYLKATNTGANDRFGRSVAISGDTLVVGVNEEDSNATGVNGDQSNNSAANSGAAYVFVRSGTNWSQQAYLKASNTEAGDRFGWQVAISGNTLVVGAPSEDSNATGVNGDQNNNNALASGAAYVFVRNGTSWSQQAYLKASNTDITDNFGWSVGISGDTLVVGAAFEESSATGVNGDQSNNNANDAGAAYIFVRSGTSWSQQAYLKASNTDPYDQFGYNVAVSGDTVVVGANLEDSSATGVNGNQNNNSVLGSGAAYVFVRSGTSWSQQAYLKASNTGVDDDFGFSVAVSGDTVMIGAVLEDSSATSVNGDQSNNSATNAGAAYVFVRSGTTWSQQSYLKASNTGAGDGFGFSVAVSGDTVVIGAYAEDSNATGVNGDQCNNNAPGAGAVYVFTSAGVPACPTITVNPANPTLPAGRAGSAYSQTFTQIGGGCAANFTVSAGALPAGLSLASNGALSGTPTVFGTFSFTVRATDTNNCMGARGYTLVVNPPCGTLTVNPATLANGFTSQGYNQTLSAVGGAAPYSFSVSAGALPGGLTLNANTGVLSGTPNATGLYNFTIQATDANQCTGARAYTIIISGDGMMFYPLPQPVRLLDTRAGFSGCTTPGAPINANGTLTLPARTTCAGIPANAAAVTGNVTVVPSGPGFLTLFPSTAIQPVVANSNFVAGKITNNVFTVGLGASDGAFKIFSRATTHVVVDVTGYYAPPAANGLFFHPLPAPVRLLETRAGFSGCITPGATLTGTGNSNADPNLDLLLQGRAPIAAPCNTIPASAQMLVGNATSVFPSGIGYLTIYPSGGTRPLIASSNYAGGDIINGPFAVKLGVDGKFKVFTLSTTHLVIDILGYYSNEVMDANGVGLLLTALPAPVRLLETRPDPPGVPLTGCTRPNAQIVGNMMMATHTQMAAGFCGLPAASQAVVGNASVVNTAGAGYLTLFPADLTTAPLVATSNYPAPAAFGYNRHFIVGLSPADGKFKVLTLFTTDLVVDASGYFAP